MNKQIEELFKEIEYDINKLADFYERNIECFDKSKRYDLINLVAHCIYAFFQNKIQLDKKYTRFYNDIAINIVYFNYSVQLRYMFMFYNFIDREEIINEITKMFDNYYEYKCYEIIMDINQFIEEYLCDMELKQIADSYLMMNSLVGE